MTKTEAAISPVARVVKRGVDAAASFAGLVALSPFFLVAAIAVKSDSPGPVFFRQVRVGRGGRPFRIYKFRSMVASAPKLGAAITTSTDARVTRVGEVLRKTKLDELPQLINVLLGDMSLVGPRPEVPEFMQFYSPEQRAVILSVQPGITDYASIFFHDESSLLTDDADPIETYRRKIMPIKFRYYAKYCANPSLAADAQILFATLCVVIFRRIPEGFRRANELVNGAGAATNEPQSVGGESAS